MAVYRLPLRDRGHAAPKITRDDRFWQMRGESDQQHASATALLLGSAIVAGSMFAFNYLDAPRNHAPMPVGAAAIYEVLPAAGSLR